MTYKKFATLVRYYTKTNDNTFTDQEILDLANIIKDDMAVRISKEVAEDYFMMRFKADLVAGQREYQLPDDIISRIKYVEAKLDGDNWEDLDEFDLIQYGKTTDESTIQDAFSGRDPQFDMWDQSIFIFSADDIIDVTDGLKLWANIYPADFTDLTSTSDMSIPPTTTSHGFPRELHRLLATAVSIEYKTSLTRQIPLSKREQNFEADYDMAINAMKDANEDRNFKASVPYNDGLQY